MIVRTHLKWVLLAMLRFLSMSALAHSLCCAATANPRPEQSASFKKIEETVSRLLSDPVYTAADERLLNEAGDSAALAVTKIVTEKELNSPEAGRRILLILHLAFEAPQSIAASADKTPKVALRLLAQLEQTEYGRQPNVVGNTRYEIKHNTSTGHPLQQVTVPGEPATDLGHTQWISNVLLLTLTIKPGMTRSDLLRVFTTEGGLSTRTQRTFVLKQCPLIKVDVQFTVSLTEANDKIAQISKPYLDFGHYD
jgi:hypothetical protein